MTKKTLMCFGWHLFQVNNAGHLGEEREITHMKLEDIDGMMAVNMKGPLLLSQLFMDDLAQTKGQGLKHTNDAFHSFFPSNFANDGENLSHNML